jgi:tRNA(fMet)-specific endonuclease VapC
VTDWIYDNAGHLLNDGATTRTYDALNRVLTSDMANYGYIGDGTLVRPTLGGTTTSYVQALATPFGFARELQQSGDLYLRARWYTPSSGQFVSKDPFAGMAEMPYSLNPYQYAYSNPVLLSDRSELCPAPPDDSGSIICVAFFIAAPAIGPPITINSTAPFPGYQVTVYQPGVGDGRWFNPNSLPSPSLRGGSRAYMYIKTDGCEQLLGEDFTANTSFLFEGLIGYGPYYEYEKFDATQEGLQVVAQRATSYQATFGYYTIASITVMEVVKGLHKVGREARIQQFLQHLTQVEVLSFDEESSVLAGRIFADLERTGQPIGRADPMIAASTLHHGLTLVTGNTTHYERIKTLGYPLVIENWRLP